MNAKAILTKGLMALATTVMLAVGGPLGAADEIKVGLLSTGGDHWPIWVAKDQNYFKQQNLELREFHTNSIAKALQALSANSTDILYPTNTQGAITAMVKNAPIKIVAGNYTKALYDLIAGPKYKRVEDLKGTTFGVINLTSGSTALLQKIMSAHGFKYPGDYDLLTVGGTPQRYAAVKKGAVAGAMVTIPTSFQAKEEGLNVVANIATYLPDYQFTVVAGHETWMENHRDQTVRFLVAIIQAMRFMTDPKNKEATIKSMLNHFKISPKYAALAYKEVIEELKPIRRDAAPSIPGIETVMKLEVERKALDKAYDPTSFINDSYRQEALRRLGG